MDTYKAIEALSVRAELNLWKGRRSIYGARRKALSSEYVLKKDVVERMERSLGKYFSLFGRNDEDKLAKAKQEVDVAKKAYEKVLFYIEEGEKRIPEFERKLKGLGDDVICSENKEQKGPSYIEEKGDKTTEKSLILWCELVEDGVLLSNSITSFLKDLVAHMERCNNAQVKDREKVTIQNSLFEVEQKMNCFFKKQRQDYETINMCNKVKKSSVYGILSKGTGNLGVILQENAMLYTIQNRMEELQKGLVEAFEVMEGDGEKLLEELKIESGDRGNLVMDEKEITIETATVRIYFPEHAHYKIEKQNEIFPSYMEDTHTQQKVIFPELEFHGQENLYKERTQLLEGIRLLREELKPVRAEVQKGMKRSNGLFGKLRGDFNEEEIPVGIKSLEEHLEGWRRQLKEFRRKARHFPCAMDGLVSMESRVLDKGYEIEDGEARMQWYLAYLDELETRMKTTEEQVMDFPIDA